MNLDGFVRSVSLPSERVSSYDKYPFAIPAVRALDGLVLDPRITFFVGDNGSGKSTVLEALAVALGFNAEGGTRNFQFATRRSESELHACLRIVRGARRPKDGFFLRAESFFNAATYIDDTDVGDSYGGRSLHEQSHGESFLALVTNRFGDNGLYLLDEPEAALSPTRQLSLLKVIHDLLARGSQFILATHSPILMAYPEALIYQFDGTGIHRVAYQETEHYQVTRSFLSSPERYLKHLLRD